MRFATPISYKNENLKCDWISDLKGNHKGFPDIHVFQCDLYIERTFPTKKHRRSVIGKNLEFK